MLSAFEQALLACQSTTDVLDLLQREAGVHGIPITAIRYYRRLMGPARDVLVSVDCVGHDDQIAEQLRSGCIEKRRRRKGKLRRVDGIFDVIDTPDQPPTVFRINPFIEGMSRDDFDGLLTYCQLRSDGCDAVLGEGSSRQPWADFSLCLANRAIGKLSCSLSTERFDLASVDAATDLASRLRIFRDLAWLSAPYLETLRALDINLPLEQAGQSIFQCSTYEKLYEYCTRTLCTLPPFDYEAADIFIVSRDTLKKHDPEEARDCEILILRGSSNEVAWTENWVNHRFYRKTIRDRPWLPADEATDGGKGLTPWVWRTGRALRLNYDPSDPQFGRQLANYRSEEESLEWQRHIDLTPNPRSFLIVPITVPDTDASPSPRRPRRVIGVIRFANKRNDEPISLREQVLLSRVADRCIAPKLMTLRHEMFSNIVYRDLDKVPLFRLDIADESTNGDQNNLHTLLADSITSFFPPVGKMVSINLLCDADSASFRPTILFSDIGARHEYQRDVPLAGSLTQYVIRNGSTVPYVFVNDLKYAAMRGSYANRNNAVTCALASAITYQDKCYGALVVLSDRFDINPGPYGRLAHVLASQLGLLIARREILDFASCIGGLRHDGGSALSGIRNLVEQLRPQISDVAYEEYNQTLDFWSDVVDVHCRSGPPLPSELRRARRSDMEYCIRCAAAQAWAAEGMQTYGSVDDHLFVQVQGAQFVSVWEPALMVCLFNLFKNAWMHGSENKTVRVQVASTDEEVAVRVSNYLSSPEGALQSRLRGQDAIRATVPADLMVLWKNRAPTGMGLRLVRRIADWHAIPDRSAGRRVRRGCLLLEEGGDPNSVTYLLRLPLIQS